MAQITVKCPYCESEKVVAYGKTAYGTKRYKCKNEEARVLGIDKNTLTRHLRKLEDAVQYANIDFLNRMSDRQIDILIWGTAENIV